MSSVINYLLWYQVFERAAVAAQKMPPKIAATPEQIKPAIRSLMRPRLLTSPPSAMATAVLKSPVGQSTAAPIGEVSVRTLGQKLMTDYVLPLEVMALLLTAAMLGAVIIAMREKEGK